MSNLYPYSTRLFFILISLSTSNLFAHGGGTKRSGVFKGCHNNKKSNIFHCHKKSQFNGKSWNSEEDAINQYNKRNKTNKAVKYERASWGNWNDPDGNCLDTRHDILRMRSLVEPTIENCKVVSGKWNDYYYNEVILDPNEIEIDHVVSIKHAHNLVGNNWSKNMRNAFYRDPENLTITQAKYNSEKGEKTFLEWHPVEKDYACKYSSQWFKIKRKYNLKVSQRELNYRKNLNCR